MLFVGTVFPAVNQDSSLYFGRIVLIYTHCGPASKSLFFSLTFVISKIQKKNPENIAKMSVHSAVDFGPFRINATKGNCLTCFP